MSMDVTLNNVLEGTRQFFLGLPNQAKVECGAAGWMSAPGAEHGALTSPAPTSRPPSAAPPRPPSEPLEPEPHIIHKATVMREALEKRREQPEPEDDEEEHEAPPSPPRHVLLRPPPAPAPAPEAAPPAPAPRTPDHYAPPRQPDPYAASRPPDHYARYHYDSGLPDSGRGSLGPPAASPQPAAPRHSPQQTYARLTNAMTPHSTARLRESPAPSPPAPARYAAPPHNDRVPPIHHPHTPPRSAGYAAPSAPAPASSHYARHASHYERHPSLPARKYDPQHAYPGYRPTAGSGPPPRAAVGYKHVPGESLSAQYAPRAPDRAAAAAHPADARLPSRMDYNGVSRSADSRSYHYSSPSTSSVRYVANATSSVPVGLPSSTASRTPYRAAPGPGLAPAASPGKAPYEYVPASHAPAAPAAARLAAAKSGLASQQARMTVSVTSIVNQMKETKQKRESPLDLSVKTVKNSADSSTTQDDVIDSATSEIKVMPMQSRSTLSLSSRHSSSAIPGYVSSHKVDFAPDFHSQYRERTQSVGRVSQPAHPPPPPAPVRYNGGFEPTRTSSDHYAVEPRHHGYLDRTKYTVAASKNEYVPRIDLTRPATEERAPNSRVRDDRHFVIGERKRPAGPIVNNIPEKIVRYETWSADSRIERMNRSAREQHELMSRPVYNYSSHKRLEAVHSDPRRIASPYRDVPVPAPAPPPAAAPHPAPAPAPRYYPAEPPARVPVDYHPHHLHHPQYIDRTLQTNGRHVIQKLPNREVHPHHHHHLQHHHNNNQPLNHHSGVPADKRVLSILRNSLETKQTGFVEPAKLANHIPDLIVIDDADDCVEITDLTKEYDAEAALRHPKVVQSGPSPVRSHIIKMPKAVDSIPRDTEYQRYENYDAKSKSPENDVASRIRTKAELKVMPPPQENHLIPDDRIESDKNKMVPKSQKQHLFNQIREDSLRLESVIKTEKFSEVKMPEVKTEPMNIDEIERDAVLPIKSETCFETESITESDPFMGDDLDWATACESFVEQLQTGCHKKKPKRKRTETETEIKPDTGSLSKSSLEQSLSISATPSSSIVIKQEPVDEEDILPMSNQEEPTEKSKLDKSIASESEYPTIKKEVENSALEETIETEAIKNKHTDHVEKECEISDPKPQKEVFKPSNKEPLAVAVIVKPNDSVAKETLNGKINEQTNKHKEIIRTKKIKEASSKEREKLKPVNKLCKQEKFKLRKLKEKGLRKIKAIENKKVETTAATVSVKKEIIETEEIKTVIKEELESTDDDEPLIKSKLLKEKEKSDLVKYQLLKDLSEKSAYVKLECCNVDMSLRKSLDSCITPKENESQNKIKLSRHLSRTKLKSISTDTTKTETKIEKQKFEESSTDSDAEEVILASRLRLRKNIKTDDNKATTSNKTSVKSSPKKHDSSSSSCSYLTPVRKPGFGDGSDFHPGWEEELYKFKRSLRMPSRLIAIPRGGSRGPFIRVSESLSAKGSTSLPDLDPPSLSPAPSITRSAVTDDFYPRKPEKVILDSDLDSNSSGSVPIRLQYDSEASTSTVISSTLIKKKGSSIVDVLIQKCGKKEDPKRKSKDKLKEDISPKIIPKTTSDLLPTPSLGLIKNGVKGNLSVKKEKILEDIFYLGPFRKETVTAYRNEFINNTDGLIGATEEFSATVLKSRTRTESKVLKQRATIREVFGDNGRPMSAPPTCNDLIKENEEVEIKKENEIKIKPKSKKICKDKIKRRSSSIRDGLRSTALKRSDAKGRLLRLKKRNTLVKKVLTNKKIKDIAANKQKRDKTSISADDDKEKCDKDKDDKEKEKDEDTSPNPEVQPVDPPVATVKKRFKRIFGRRKLSSGFDYIRKKKKIIRKKDGVVVKKIRRPAVKPSPESVHDIHKEVKGWFINKSIGETHLHRAARLGYTDCVAYCLEKMSRDPSAKDNAGFTALHVAAARGHVRIARLLLQYGANVSAAAQGGIRPLHEAAENNHVEMIRLLLSYGADPLLGTYGGLTPVELADGGAAHLLQLHIADVQGRASDPWRFPSPAVIIDPTSLGCDALSSPPPGSPPPPETTLEFQCTEAPLPPFYSLRGAPGQPPEGLWCLLSDVTAVLQIKSKESLLKQIHCGSGSPRELLREIRTQEFLERAQCHQLLAAGEKVNVRASKVALVRVTDKLRQLLKVETVLVS